MTPNRSVVLYIAMSLDGYIAAQNDDLSFLATVEQTGEDYGYAAFIETVDTVIMGRKTFDWVWDALGHVPHSAACPKPNIPPTFGMHWGMCHIRT